MRTIPVGLIQEDNGLLSPLRFRGQQYLKDNTSDLWNGALEEREPTHRASNNIIAERWGISSKAAFIFPQIAVEMHNPSLQQYKQ